MHVDTPTNFHEQLLTLSIIFIKLNICTIKSSKTYIIIFSPTNLRWKKKSILLRNYIVHLSLISRIQDSTKYSETHKGQCIMLRDYISW